MSIHTYNGTDKWLAGLFVGPDILTLHDAFDTRVVSNQGEIVAFYMTKVGSDVFCGYYWKNFEGYYLGVPDPSNV